MQIQICVYGYVARNPAEFEFTRTRDVAAGGYGGVVVDIRQRPTRLLRRGREASKETGEPEADAAFIGAGDLRRERKQRGKHKGAELWRPKIGSKIRPIVFHLLAPLNSEIHTYPSSLISDISRDAMQKRQNPQIVSL